PFDADFTLNGNYGIAVFRGSAAGVSSNSVLLEITGECKEEAQARLEARIALIREIGDMAAVLKGAFYALATVAAEAILTLIVGFLIGVSLGLGAVFVIIGILVGLAVYAEMQNQTRKKIAELRKEAQ